MSETLLALCFVVALLCVIVWLQHRALRRLEDDTRRLWMHMLETVEQNRDIITVMGKHYDITEGLFEAAKNITLAIEHILKGRDWR